MRRTAPLGVVNTTASVCAAALTGSLQLLRSAGFPSLGPKAVRWHHCELATDTSATLRGIKVERGFPVWLTQSSIQWKRSSDQHGASLRTQAATLLPVAFFTPSEAEWPVFQSPGSHCFNPANLVKTTRPHSEQADDSVHASGPL